jgi:hypothetical protein
MPLFTGKPLGSLPPNSSSENKQGVDMELLMSIGICVGVFVAFAMTELLA